MSETFPLNVVRESGKSADALILLAGDAEPAKPFRFVRSGPKSGVAGPKPPSHSRRAAMPQVRQQTVLLELCRELISLTVKFIAEVFSAFAGHGAKKLVEGIGEQLHSLR